MATFALPGRSEYREDIEYGKAGDLSLRMDTHVPGGPGPFPAVIVVHGGGWVMGDRKHTVEPLFKPLANADFAWFSISYRLAGQTERASIAEQGISSLLMLGTAADDVRQAVSYVKDHAVEYRVDVNRIALVGESAGAQLASMAALRPGQNGAVRAVVALYCPSDLFKLALTSTQIPDNLRRAIQGTPWESMVRERLKELSPINWIRKDAPPFLLIHGTEDALVPFTQSTQFREAMRAAGESCEVYPVQGGGHGLHWWEHEHLTAYKQYMVEWLAKTMKGPAVHDT